MSRLLTLALLFGAARLGAQEPIRADLVGSARVGQKAPEVLLPYFTEAGPGPTDQPFRLSAELGRAVVLVFGPPDQLAWWQAVAQARTSWDGAVFAGLLANDAVGVANLATKLGAPGLKLLPDEHRVAGRRFGVARLDRVAVVVGETGMIALVRRDFDPGDTVQTAEIAAVLRPVRQ